jgi:hypothetical protein
MKMKIKNPFDLVVCVCVCECDIVRLCVCVDFSKKINYIIIGVHNKVLSLYSHTLKVLSLYSHTLTLDTHRHTAPQKKKRKYYISTP